MTPISTQAARIGIFNKYAARARNLLRNICDEPDFPITCSDVTTLKTVVQKAKDLPDYVWWLNMLITAFTDRDAHLQTRLILRPETPFPTSEHRLTRLHEQLLEERDAFTQAREAARAKGEAPPTPQVLVPTATSGRPFTAEWVDPLTKYSEGPVDPATGVYLTPIPKPGDFDEMESVPPGLENMADLLPFFSQEEIDSYYESPSTRQLRPADQNTPASVIHTDPIRAIESAEQRRAQATLEGRLTPLPSPTATTLGP